MRTRTLIAGIGNIFLGDDGFGSEVARRLAAENLPHVKVEDFGIRGMHLAYEMLDGAYETVVLVDAMPRGGAPGTVYLMEPDWTNIESSTPDAHSMSPEAVLAMLKYLGGKPARLLILGCEPESVEEGIGLSEPVTHAVELATRLARELASGRDMVRAAV